MSKIISNNNIEIDAAFSLGSDGDKSGLILESWGPSTRNPKYNDAFECIIDRLKYLGITHFYVYIISRELLNNFTQERRTVLIDGSDRIDLNSCPTPELRLKIGQVQAATKLNPSSTGGNYTKRILIHSPGISFEDWERIATTPNSQQLIEGVRGRVTGDRDELEDSVDLMLRGSPTQAPNGQRTPRRISITTEQIERDPKVKAWVLWRAGGVCEVCLNQAPFTKDNGIPFLEVHHVRTLSTGGTDTKENTIAVCPNCHKALHYSNERDEMVEKLYTSVPRLIRE